ncbi:MAG: hypothetical protein Q8P60_03965 [Pseudorhodobacter sp.]|nr:hypothetical protein [Pseudorhodobacter sp.]
MMKAVQLGLCLALTAVHMPVAAGAADFSDPDWPCIQRKVETLSPGLMWPDPISAVPLDQSARDLVAALALRRVGLDAAEQRIKAFSESPPGADAQVLGNVFLGVFDKLNSDRRRLIDGIARYAHSQTALADRIDSARTEVETQMAATAPDFDRIDALEEQIDWDERIYKDRARALTYVCETPVLLEKRAYAIAQLLLKYAPQ